GRSDFAHEMITAVHHVHVPGAIDSHSLRAGKSRLVADAISAAADTGRASKGAHQTRRTDFSYRGIKGVTHIHIITAIHGDSLRKIKTRRRAKSIGGARSARRTGERADIASRSDLPYRVVPGIAHVDIAGAVNRDPCGKSKPRVRAVTIRRPWITG